jgi:NucS shadow ORF
MSLAVPAEMIEQAQRGPIPESDFVSVIRSSLPRAWRIVEELVARRERNYSNLESYGGGPMDDQTRGELLRMVAGSAIRGATERHFGVELLFQNCHNIAVVGAGQSESAEALEFCSIESQILNQQPEFQFC